MSNYNYVAVQGNLVKDPNFREYENLKRCQFTIASNKKIEEREKTTYISCIAFGNIADVCSEYLKKGYEVLVTGELSSYLRELADGSSYTQISILVKNVILGNNKLKDYKELDRDETLILLGKDLEIEELEKEESFEELKESEF